MNPSIHQQAFPQNLLLISLHNFSPAIQSRFTLPRYPNPVLIPALSTTAPTRIVTRTTPMAVATTTKFLLPDTPNTTASS